MQFENKNTLAQKNTKKNIRKFWFKMNRRDCMREKKNCIKSNIRPYGIYQAYLISLNPGSDSQNCL